MVTTLNQTAHNDTYLGQFVIENVPLEKCPYEETEMYYKNNTNYIIFTYNINNNINNN